MRNLHRYHRQMLLSGIGEVGQRHLDDSHALIVGCGALGCAIADALARAGVGTLTIVDRDVVEITNLQRQVLYDERDVAQGTPKALAAANRLRQINSDIRISAHADDFNASNAERFIRGVDVLIDGLDNFQARYLLNDLAMKHHLPYVYGGAVAMTGMTMAILPHRDPGGTPGGRVNWTDEQSTPCLRCVFPDAPPPGASATCDTAGVLGPVVSIVAAMQTAQVIKLLAGNLAGVERALTSIDLQDNSIRHFDVSSAWRPGECPCCGQRRFEHLEGAVASSTTSLCGRNAVQVLPSSASNGQPASVNLKVIASRLRPHGEFACNDFLLRGQFAHEHGELGEPVELTLFPNGRAIIKGTARPELARSIYDKYVGG
jgi:adenylyltransferase/sulfurtransferase